DGTLATPVNYPVGVTGPNAIAIGDFNGDQIRDLAVANVSGTTNNLSVLLGAANGTFGTATNYNTTSFANDVAVGDFNGDGFLDIAMQGQTEVAIHLGTGTGTFGAANKSAAGAWLQAIAAADFDSNGTIDVALIGGTPTGDV